MWPSFGPKWTNRADYGQGGGLVREGGGNLPIKKRPKIFTGPIFPRTLGSKVPLGGGVAVEGGGYNKAISKFFVSFFHHIYIFIMITPPTVRLI